MNYTAINLSQIQDVKNVINDEILITAAGVTEQMWENLGIIFKPGIENMFTQYIYAGNYKGSAPKYHGSTLNNTLGEMIPRHLVVKSIWNRVPDSLDNYYETAPISMAKLSEEGVTAENTQFHLLRAAEQTSSQVRQNFFLGKRPANKTAYDALPENEKEYALYDGIFEHIANMIAGKTDEDKDAQGQPLISEENGNLIPTEPLLGASDPVETYDNVVDFYQSLSGSLVSNNETIYFYVSDKLINKIRQGYNLKYKGMQTPDVNKPEFRFTDMPNVEFKFHAVFGYGDCIIATKEDNLIYGTDITTDGEPNKASIEVNKDPDDAHNLIIQIDLRAGTLIMDPTKGAFATNGEKNYPSYQEWLEKQAQTLPTEKKPIVDTE